MVSNYDSCKGGTDFKILVLTSTLVAVILHGFFQSRPSDRSLSAKLVPTLAERGCCVVSATDPHGR
jgi:hypothetical protein